MKNYTYYEKYIQQYEKKIFNLISSYKFPVIRYTQIDVIIDL